MNCNPPFREMQQTLLESFAAKRDAMLRVQFEHVAAIRLSARPVLHASLRVLQFYARQRTAGFGRTVS
jgi:hypothetical protein